MHYQTIEKKQLALSLKNTGQKGGKNLLTSLRQNNDHNKGFREKKNVSILLTLIS